MNDRVPIRKLPAGVPGLDEVLGGGFPEFSFNLIAGGPGSGKTTMAHQIMFANATSERRAVYFSIIGEPPIKMLRYQQQYEFFDAARVGERHGVDIHDGQRDEGLEAVSCGDGQGVAGLQLRGEGCEATRQKRSS